MPADHTAIATSLALKYSQQTKRRLLSILPTREFEESLISLNSTISFYDLVVASSEGGVQCLKVALKFVPKMAGELWACLSANFFANESLMYKEILPCLLGNVNLVPEFYASDESYECLMLQDISGSGFRTPMEGWCLDDDHVFLAVERLGIFHGLSYKAKTGDIGKYDEILKGHPYSRISKYGEVFELSLKSILKSLIEKKEGDARLLNCLLERFPDWKFFANTFTQPEEPFSVICHGDFNKNNIMFLYDNESKPVDLRFIDFQYAHYGDPTTDLGFLLYMNTSQEMRDARWNDYLNHYWKSVTSVAPRLDFTRETFFEHLASRFLGIVPTLTLFFPVVVPPINISIEEFDLGERFRHFHSDLYARARTEFVPSVELITDVIKDMLKRGYFEKGVRLISNS